MVFAAEEVKTRLNYFFLYLTGMPFRPALNQNPTIEVIAHANLVAVDHREKRKLTE